MCHVLIIEDEPFTAYAIELVLEEAGASSFDTADNEADAVRLARARRPDVITSDISLREGSGADAVRAIHREVGEIPVIYLTGTPGDADGGSASDSVLSKPFDQRALVDAYNRARPG